MFVIAAVACVAVRIVWVNTHARIPENKIYARGESLVDKKGFIYTIEGATLYYPSDFERLYNNGEKYIKTRTEEDLRVLVVQIKLESKGDNSSFDVPSNYLEGAEVLCMVDNDKFSDFNPSLVSGEFRLGDQLNYVFPIYKENYPKRDWDRINHLDVNYDIVFSTYPVRECMDIGEVKWYEEK